MKMYKEMKKINLAAIVVLLVLSGGLALATPSHLLPTPASLGQDYFLEAESATVYGGTWYTWHADLSKAYYGASSGDSMFLQWEGLSLVGGDYQAYVSWTLTGSGWLTGKVWAGPDAANLRLVVPSYEEVELVNETYQWNPIWPVWGGTPSVLPLLATDTVIKVSFNGTASWTIVDAVMLTVPEPMTVVLLGIGASSLLIRRRK